MDLKTTGAGGAGMRRFVTRWHAPHLHIVVGCGGCGRDVSVRWPERWAECAACGTASPLSADGSGASLLLATGEPFGFWN